MEDNLTDTDRLNFLLKFFHVDDMGEEGYCPVVIISSEYLEDILTFGPEGGDRCSQCDTEDIRIIIDKTIKKTLLIGGDDEKTRR